MRHKLRWKLQHWLEGRVPGLLMCRDFETFVDAYVDGELGPVARVTVDFHMKTCPICQRYLEAYRRVRDLAVDAVSAEDAAALDAVPEDLVGAILAARAAEIDRPGA